MKASVMDLRTRMREVFKALRRNEKVEILYHGKPAARIIPIHRKKLRMRVSEHPFFGMRRASGHEKSVYETVRDLRRGRYGSV
ncbi:MAG: type II toxin-antitoxin system Phd/YefM family antitoxin [Candidatus Omnitrophica bacterium]|nr:type II toxin-antitoxin system Phd/YefM family antitoxin [Candidatus Omnitrophota bacterium]